MESTKQSNYFSVCLNTKILQQLIKSYKRAVMWRGLGKQILILIVMFLSTTGVAAHEPLYGFGPHVLFKNGLAPHITLNWNSSKFETEYALGYGITRNWTMIAETPWSTEGGNYNFGGVNLKSKYRFWLKT